jgi:NADP-dependent 3-hydroxy acid dehydrogenase YdfG
VGLVGRRAQALARVARRIGGDAKVFTADLTADAQVRAAVRQFLRHFGRIDILVHSNGIHRAGLLAEAKAADFDRLWAANVRGPFQLTQLLLPGLRASSGQIVFVNSSVVLATRAGVGQFTATQHALRALADTLRMELNSEGIRVLSVYPGRTATSRSESITAEEGRSYRPERLLQPEEIAKVVVESLGLPRTAEVTDISIRPMLKPL